MVVAYDMMTDDEFETANHPSSASDKLCESQTASR